MSVKGFIKVVGAAVLVACGGVWAQSVEALTEAIVNYNSGGEGSLEAEVDGNTVTVTGEIVDATTKLTLDVPEDVKVIWKASLSGNTGKADGNPSAALVAVGSPNDNYKFEIADGGSIVQLGDQRAIYFGGANSELIVSGGTVSATTGSAISGEGTIIVSGGEISSISGYAIYVGSSVVTVSGGTVSTASGNAIYSYGTMCTINVSGTGEVKATDLNGRAIYTNGGTSDNSVINISGGTVSSAVGLAIFAAGRHNVVSVSGGMVTGKNGILINDNQSERLNVIVSGTGKVEATERAIRVNGNGSVEISDNALVSSENYAIYISGSSAGSNVITINGGTVSTTDGTAIYSYGSKSEIIVSGTGKVEAINDDCYAIRSRGNVEIKDNGVVSAPTGIAITGTSEYDVVNVVVSGGEVNTVTGTAIVGGTITVSGGLVSATSGTAVSPGSITVDGGTVSATTGKAIDGGNITINGGLVSATEGRAINSESYGTILIKGGTVSATIGTAVHIEDDAVQILGGAIIATTGTAIVARNVFVMGGVIFAHGSAIMGENNVIHSPDPVTPMADYNGVIIANNDGKSLSYLPSKATVKYETRGGVQGVSYTNGSNSGFIPLDGQVVSVASPDRKLSARSQTAVLTVRGKTLNVRASSPTAVSQIRVVDVKGRTVRSFKARGDMAFSLSRLPAGRYLVEVREASGKRLRQSFVLR